MIDVRKQRHTRAAPCVQQKKMHVKGTEEKEVHKLKRLLENGVAKRFDLRQWVNKGCAQATARERLEVLFEQVRPEVAKLIVLEALEVSYATRTRSSFMLQCSAQGRSPKRVDWFRTEGAFGLAII